MKILNPEELTRRTTCLCKAYLEYNFDDILYDYDEKEKYIICPNCKRRLLVNIDKPYGKEW